MTTVRWDIRTREQAMIGFVRRVSAADDPGDALAALEGT